MTPIDDAIKELRAQCAEDDNKVALHSLSRTLKTKRALDALEVATRALGCVKNKPLPLSGGALQYIAVQALDQITQILTEK